MEDVERRGVLMVVMGMESAGLALYSRWSERSGRDDVNMNRAAVSMERVGSLAERVVPTFKAIKAIKAIF